MLAAFLSLLAFAPLQNPPTQVPTAPAPDRAGEPDIMISVHARADQVRWRQVGSVTVRAWSEPGGNVIEENLTTGLPRPIPGQRTFRNVEWSLLAGACVNTAQFIVESGPVETDRRCERATQINIPTGDTPQ
jgi:hypothetical protein